jgi:hypothetical protein
MSVESQAYSITDARYAKGKKVVRTPSNTGYKTRAAYLVEALGGRWVNRGGGYVVSPAAADKFERLYRAGFDARIRLFRDSPASFYHTERGLDGLSASDALRLA